MEGAGGIRTDGSLFGGKSFEKTFPGWIVRMIDAIPSQDLPGGHQQNLAIEPQGTVVEAPEGERKFLFPRERLSSIDLHPSGNTGKPIVPTMLFRQSPAK